MQNITKIIFLGGAPGAGKTTTSRLLHKKLKNSALVELSWIRGFHLDNSWSNATNKEEKMSFENLVFILKNYIKNNYSYVIVADLLDERVVEIPKIFDEKNFLIFSLIVNDDDELKKRVLDAKRDSGFRDYNKSLEWNRKLIKRDLAINEDKIDNTKINPEEVTKIILQKINEEQ